MENMFPPKAEMLYWGHCGIGNVLPKIVKLPNIHQRLTRQKMRMDNLLSRRSLSRNVPNTASPLLGEHVLHLVLHVHCAYSGIRRAPLVSTSDWKSAKSVHAEHLSQH